MPSSTTNPPQPTCTQLGSTFPLLINGNDRHAGSAPCRTCNRHANAATWTKIGTTARLDSRLSEKTRFGLVLMRRNWNNTRQTSNRKEISAQRKQGTLMVSADFIPWQSYLSV